MTDSIRAEFVPATLEDIPLLVSMMPGVYVYEGEMPDAAGWTTAVAELIQTPSLGTLWMIHWQGQPIGYVAVTLGFTLEFYGRTATIDELFVGGGRLHLVTDGRGMFSQGYFSGVRNLGGCCQHPNVAGGPTLACTPRVMAGATTFSLPSGPPAG